MDYQQLFHNLANAGLKSVSDKVIKPGDEMLAKIEFMKQAVINKNLREDRKEALLKAIANMLGLDASFLD